MRRARNAFFALRRVVVSLWAGTSPLVSEATAQARDAVCTMCPHFSAQVCNLCGCIAPLKARLSTETCPDVPDRWKNL